MLSARRLHFQRGQTLYEAAVFIPLLCVAFMSMLFFSRLGVLSERSQSAVRYGEMVSFKNGSPYTLATVNSVIDEVLHSNSSELGPICLEPNGPMTGPTGSPIPTSAPGGETPILALSGSASAGTMVTPAPQNTSVANRVAADTQAALILAQVVATPPAVGTPYPSAPSAKPFWQPDHLVSSNCNPASIALQQGAFSAGNLPVSVQSVSVSSSLNIPSYLSFVMNGETSARMGFVNVATPNTLLGCVPGLSIVLTVLNPATAGKAGPECPAVPTAGS